MKQGVLRTLALAVLLLVISPGIVFAEETTYEYVTYDAYEIYEVPEDEPVMYDDVEHIWQAEIHHEPVWQTIQANVASPQGFFFRIEGGAAISFVNEHDGWHWLIPPWLLANLEREGFDISYFRNSEEAMDSIPQLEYVFSTWAWGPEIIAILDMPALQLRANANARIEFDFYAESLMTLSWGGDAHVEMERVTGGFIAPGASVTLPGSPSFTAVYFHVAYGPGNPMEYGHVLLFLEVFGEDGRRALAYSFNPQDHIPSDFAAPSIYRAVELGILPEFFDRSLRKPINRLEFATLAVYLHEAVMQREIAGRAHFNDTADINAGKMGFLGVMTENEFGNFSPRSPVTREQAALLISRLATVSGLHLPVVDGRFADSELIAGWAQEAALQVFGAGIITAQYGLFEPNRVLTREETIVMMVRLFDLLAV